MYHLCSHLIVYENFGENCILYRIAGILEDFDLLAESGTDALERNEDKLVLRAYREVKRLLDLATDYGFDGNLWQNYLTWLLVTNENSFTLTAEKSQPQDGSINVFVHNDLAIFMKLFHYDFLPLEAGLGIDCFTTLTHYKAIEKHERMYNRQVSEQVRRLSEKLALCQTVDAFFTVLRAFYETHGVGIFAVNRAFRCRRALPAEENEGSIVLYPVNNTDDVILSDLVGYESQKEKLVRNTKAFVNGLPANNCLLYGDSGTGKSTAIKAICNEFYDKGLRLIELYKHQCRDLSAVISQIKNRNYYFIIYMDDLSFEEFETEYKYLKAVIEGGVERRPDNVLIYATSNRRHLIRENWSDRADMDASDDLHRSDTMQEKLSLFNRFGVTIQFGRPNKTSFNEIVLALAKRQLAHPIPNEALLSGANRWEIAHGGTSGRTAQQYIDYLAGEMASE
ncbi:MAG: ATP-binding protein [Lachnospiraceae bacterium]|nr:ATP-binding protein [Lachnospiraceae bacterium]